MSFIDGHYILYSLIHFLYTILEISWKTFKFIYTVIKFCIGSFYTRPKQKSSHNDDPDQLMRRLSRISKKPNHLTVIVGAEEYSLDNLAGLIFWCLAFEIPFVSFYDYNGNLKKDEEKLEQIVMSKKPEDVNIIWHLNSGMHHKNGFQGKKIHVKVLTNEDGRRNIVKLTKELAISRDKDISIETISEKLRRQYEFPDPEMALTSGKTLNLYNYPPWQLRLTEFFQVSVSNITFFNFVESLEKYSKCEQRVGK